MNDGAEAILCKKCIQHVAVAQVGLTEDGTFPGNFLDAPDGGYLTVAEIIDNDHLIARVEEFHAGVAADIARPAGNKYFHQSALLLPKYNSAKLFSIGYAIPSQRML
jgi:hypothetical protein